MTAVTGFDDRDMVNQCLLYRYVMSYEPITSKVVLPTCSDRRLRRQMDSLRSSSETGSGW